MEAAQFLDLFQALPEVVDEGFFNMDGSSGSDLQNFALIASPSLAEIRDAVFFLKRGSSPGTDGFVRCLLSFHLAYNWSRCGLCCDPLLLHKSVAPCLQQLLPYLNPQIKSAHQLH